MARRMAEHGVSDCRGRRARPVSADPKRLNDFAAIASVGVAAILIGAKFAIWIASGSVAILGSLVDFVRGGAPA